MANVERNLEVPTVINNILNEMGISMQHIGYSFLRKAIEIAIVAYDSDAIINAKKIYTDIADEFATTAERVERSISSAIKFIWDFGDVDVRNHYFGYTIQNHWETITNSEFIAMIADTIRLRYNFK